MKATAITDERTIQNILASVFRERFKVFPERHHQYDDAPCTAYRKQERETVEKAHGQEMTEMLHVIAPGLMAQSLFECSVRKVSLKGT
ncbi:MAG: hypothetical protein ACM3JB_25485 [Acidobacteriaceae bacterium]